MDDLNDLYLEKKELAEAGDPRGLLQPDEKYFWMRLHTVSAMTRFAQDEWGCNSILDVGCGYGTLANLIPADMEYTGLDLFEHLVEVSKRQHPHHEFHRADILKPLPPRLMGSKFDLVVAHGVISTQKPKDVPRLLERLFDRAKTAVMFSYLNRDRYSGSMHSYVWSDIKALLPKHSEVHVWSEMDDNGVTVLVKK